MISLVRAELLKIRTTRSWWAYLIVTVLITGIAVAGQVGTAGSETRSTVAFQRDLVDTIGIVALFAIILGITVITTEFRHGTTTPTFLAEPRRERVIAAKTIAAAVVAPGLAVLSLLVVAVIAVPWLAIVDASMHFGAGEVLTRGAQEFLAVVLWALMGVAVGTVVHSQVAALVGTLIWVFVGETLLLGLFSLLDVETVYQYLPFRALDAVDGTGGDDVLAYGSGLAVSAAWIAAIGAAGVVRTRRRDIT